MDSIGFLTTNKYLVLIDHADWLQVLRYDWYFNQGYIKRLGDYKNLNVFLTGNKITRHLNGNPFDFRRENLA